MRYKKLLLLVALMLVPVMLHSAPVTAEEGAVPEIGDDGVYHIRIEASQWEFKAFDLVKIYKDAGIAYEDLASGIDFLSAEEQEGYEVKHRIGSFDKGSKIVFHLVSRDVQHGFSINEIGLAEALIRPTAGNEFGNPTVTDEFDLPNEDTTLSGFCHIFCGLGHPDMKLKFIIGEGAFEVGPIVFYAALAINLGIFGLYLRSIISKVKLLPEEPVSA